MPARLLTNSMLTSSVIAFALGAATAYAFMRLQGSLRAMPHPHPQTPVRTDLFVRPDEDYPRSIDQVLGPVSADVATGG